MNTSPNLPIINFSKTALIQASIVGAKTEDKVRFVQQHELDGNPRTLRAWLFEGQCPTPAVNSILLDRFVPPGGASPGNFIATTIKWRGKKPIDTARYVANFIGPARLAHYSPRIWVHLICSFGQSSFIRVPLDDIATTAALGYHINNFHKMGDMNSGNSQTSLLGVNF